MIDTNDMRAVVNTLFPAPNTLTDEAMQRAYINRSYYVVYHELLAMIEGQYQFDMSDNGEFGNTGSHNRIFLALKEVMKASNNKDVQMLAYKFRDYLSKRHKADYKLDDDCSETEYQQVFRYAEQIPTLIDKIINS